MHGSCWECEYVSTFESSEPIRFTDSGRPDPYGPTRQLKHYQCCLFPARLDVEKYHWCYQFVKKDKVLEPKSDDSSDPLRVETERSSE